VVVTTDGSGLAKVENLRPGTYTLKSAASGLRGGRLAITAPIFGRSSGLLQGDFGGDWWSILAKLSLALDP
jgi:hypothetical protein